MYVPSNLCKIKLEKGISHLTHLISALSVNRTPSQGTIFLILQNGYFRTL